jgi:hypothetical protein
VSVKNIAAVMGNPVSLQQEPHRFRLADVLMAVSGAMSKFAIDEKSFRQYLKGSKALHQSYLVSLGTDLIAFKFGRRNASGPAAVGTLEMMLRRKFGHLSDDMRRRIAAMTIGEWAHEACSACHGTRWRFTTEGVKTLCNICESSGARRYDDCERAEVLGISLRRLPELAAAIGHAEYLIATGRSAATDAAKKAYGL